MLLKNSLNLKGENVLIVSIKAICMRFEMQTERKTHFLRTEKSETKRYLNKFLALQLLVKHCSCCCFCFSRMKHKNSNYMIHDTMIEIHNTCSVIIHAFI